VTNYTAAEINTLLPTVNSGLPAQAVVQVGQDGFLPALAARLNVLAMFKLLFNLPSSASLQKRNGVIPAVLCLTARNEDGATALHLAAASGRHKVTRALLSFSTVSVLADEELAVASSAAMTGERRWPRLLAECAAHGGHAYIARAVARRANDPRLRLMCAGLAVMAGGLQAVTIETEVEERPARGGGGGVRPLLGAFKEQCALRGVFPCPLLERSYFEVEIVRAGDAMALSLGFASDRWSGWELAEEDDDTAWGVAGRSWKDGDVVGLGVDREKGTVFLSINGKFERDGTRLPEGLRVGELRPALAGRSSAVRVRWGGPVEPPPGMPAPFDFPIWNFPSVLSHTQKSHE
jgi:hypothetical protein